MLSPYIYPPATCLAIYTTILIMQNSPPSGQSIPADIETIHMNAGLIKTTAIVSAAQILLSLFDASSLATLQFSHNATDQPTPVYFPHPKLPSFHFVGEQFGASTWSNFPVSDVPRPGIRLGEMNTAQHSAVMHLLRTALSEKGFRKMQEIMASDHILADSGVPYAAGRAAYTVAILGEPATEKVWMIQFGGHHLALNIAVCGGNAVLTRVLTGALPASYTGEDGEKRVLADENDKAFALMRSFSESQRTQAVFTHPVSDMVQGPGDFDNTLPNVGIQGSHLDSSQKEMLLDLISEWVGILNDVHSASRIAEVQNDLDNTCFAWSGPFEHEPGRNGASYFRIQGPNLFTEFPSQFPGATLQCMCIRHIAIHQGYMDALCRKASSNVGITKNFFSSSQPDKTGSDFSTQSRCWWYSLASSSNLRSRLHSLGSPSSHIPNPIGSHFAADFLDRTTYRRVINGTLGFVHLLATISQILNKRDALTFDNDAPNLRREIVGLKLSHIHPCNTDYGIFSPSISGRFACFRRCSSSSTPAILTATSAA